jgi:hypothetical protein
LGALGGLAEGGIEELLALCPSRTAPGAVSAMR